MTNENHFWLDLFSSSLLLRKRKTRDELSHNIFLMLQETNKFREHQARYNLIKLLEAQLEERQRLLEKLRREMTQVDDILGTS